MNRRAARWALASALLLAGLGVSTVSHADDPIADGDGAVPVVSNALNFGNRCVGTTYTDDALIAINRMEAVPNDGNNHLRVFGNSATVTMSLRTPPDDSTDITESMTDATIVLPSNWTTTALNTKSTDTATVLVTLTPSTTGALSANVFLRASGINSTGSQTINRDTILKVTWTGVSCDTTPPVITPNVSGTLGNNGWYTSDVTVSWSVVDSQSAISSSSGCGSTTITADTAGTTLTCTATSGGGTASNSVTIKRDATAPTATATASPAPNSNGWNNTSVSVSFSGLDSGSGIGSCSATVVLASEGAGQSASGTCTDQAGNTSLSATANNINIDKTAPSVSLVGGPANGASYYFGSVPAAPTCSASDALSGLAGACNVSGYSSALGTHTVTASALDNAANGASASATYDVLAWTLKGFYQPVDMDGVVNVVKGGATVPLKFEVFAGSTELTGTGVVTSFKQAKFVCDTSDEIDDIEITTTGGTSLRYDTTAGQFIQNWQTPKQPGTCYKVTVTTQDGSALTALFKLK